MKLGLLGISVLVKKMKIEIDLKKSVEENASYYYEKSKKAKKKLSGAIKAVEEAKKNQVKKREEAKKKEELEKKKSEALKRQKQWFEKYKWFFTSNKALVISGRDASTNEEVVKKHAEKDDWVFHTDLPGSPFSILKNKEGLSEIDYYEAAQFTALHSKIWSQGFKAAEVYMVKPEQLSKTPRSGEYISKGSFMIYGKRKTYKVSLTISVGLYNDLVMIGPETAIKKNCDVQLKLDQGSLKKSEAANKIMKFLKLHTNDDIISALPQGKFSVKAKNI